MKIIQHYLDLRPTSEWITQSSGLCCLRLDTTVPVDDIAHEWESVKHLAVLHRPKESISDKFFYGHRGWKSLTIYGVHHQTTELTEGKRSWTEVADLCPLTKNWLEQNFCIDDTTGRIRFMLLEPGGYILPHTDRPEKGLFEINIAITNPQGCIFRFTNYGNVPFEKGSAFLMDISNQHLVYNNSDAERLHIIVHGKLKDTSIIQKSYENRYHS